MRTFNLVVLAILGLFIASCDDDDRLGDWEQFSGAGREGAICFKDEATQTVFVGLGFGTRSEEFADMYQFDGKNWSQINTTFPAPENKGSDPTWTKDNGNGRHSAVAFVVGDYAYVGTGYVTALSNNTVNRDRKFFNDFYRFNLKTKQWDANWSSIMTVNGKVIDGRRDAVAFSDGTYGYVGTGYGESTTIYTIKNGKVVTVLDHSNVNPLRHDNFVHIFKNRSRIDMGLSHGYDDHTFCKYSNGKLYTNSNTIWMTATTSSWRYNQKSISRSTYQAKYKSLTNNGKGYTMKVYE